MSAYQEGSHIMWLRIVWPLEDAKPDLAVENAKMFLIGQPIVVSPDGGIYCPREVSGLRSFEYVMDLSNSDNLSFMTGFRELVEVEKDRFKIKDPEKARDIIVLVSSAFGDKLLLVDRDGFLYVSPEDREIDLMDGIPRT